MTSEAYSSPSIVLAARSGDGGKIIFDDFREAYYWLRHNTPEDAKVMSWLVDLTPIIVLLAETQDPGRRQNHVLVS